MAIGNRVSECIDKLNQSDYENALTQLSVAFDGTAKKEYPREKRVGKRFKRFLHDTQDIITYCTFAGILVTENRYNGYTLEDIIYKVLRCGLLHEGSIPDEIEFVDKIVWGHSNGKWILPKSYVLGGLLAVIGAPSNTGQRVPDHYSVIAAQKGYPVNQLWGRIDLIRQIIRAHSVHREQTRGS